MRGVFPGSFDPLTVAHLAVADAAVEQLALVELHLVVSRVAIGKEDVRRSTPEERVAAILAHAADRPWLRAGVTEARLLADIAEGFDVLVVGVDKWEQMLDPRFYGSQAARDEALARLPMVVVAPRAGQPAPGGAIPLAVPADVAHVSSTAVRDGRDDWLARPGPPGRGTEWGSIIPLGG